MPALSVSTECRMMLITFVYRMSSRRLMYQSSAISYRVLLTCNGEPSYSSTAAGGRLTPGSSTSTIAARFCNGGPRRRRRKIVWVSGVASLLSRALIAFNVCVCSSVQ